jgi:signal peptidase I
MSSKPRRSWTAALLTLLTRGLGHLYAGEPKRGFILFGIEQLLLLAFAIATLVVIPNIIFMLFAVVGGFTFTIFCVFDAVSIARRKKNNYELAKYNRWFVYVGYVVVLSFVISSLLSAVMKTNFVQAYKIPSGAMMPTLLIGDHLLANKYIYKTTEPKRGDIIIFPFPDDPSRDFVKRLIAVEGDVVEMRDKRLYLNGKEQLEPYIINTDNRMIRKDTRDDFGPVTVPPGYLFFMGDNRDQSYDSRFYGFVPKSTIKGKAMSLYWSWDNVSRKVRWDRIGKVRANAL